MGNFKISTILVVVRKIFVKFIHVKFYGKLENICCKNNSFRFILKVAYREKTFQL